MSEGVSYGEASLALFLYGPVAYLAAAVFGAPMFLLFRALRLKSVLAYAFGGAGIGLATASILLVLSPWDADPSFLVAWLIGGALSASVFRLILSALKYDETPTGSTGGEI